MIRESHQKVAAHHLKRKAYLYIRQSTLKQVMQNNESTRRQYDLRGKAVALGWPTDQVIVIDNDLGQSGASASDRKGFQTLVSEVGMGRAGIVMGLEVSRLARNCSDWHRLLEICALTDTLILDEDGLYDPSYFNDRLLLGLKGAMSEAELHVMKARLQGGLLNKAKRGEFRTALPVGLQYSLDGRVVLDSDGQVRKTLKALFDNFHRTGSAFLTVKHFSEQNLLFPRRPRYGPGKGELHWGKLTHSRVLQVLHNPRYAGTYVYGRTRTQKLGQGGRKLQKLDRDEWFACIFDAHESYISWQDHEQNICRLQENAQAHGLERRKSPPREGPALLQGLAICGVCGKRMTVRYHERKGHLYPDYICQTDGIENAKPICQHIPGTDIDQVISQLLLATVTPVALEVSLAVQQELQGCLQETDRLRRQQVERARYEADLARCRFMQVDPNNRMVADVLEAEWNEKLRNLTQAQEDYEKQRQADKVVLTEQTRAEILKIATDFPRIWKNPKIPDRERKRLARLILEDVTLIKGQEITINIRFKGGKTKTITEPLALNAGEKRKTKPQIVAEIDKLLDHHTDSEISSILDQKSYRSGEGKQFHSRIIGRIRRAYELKSHYDRLRARGMLTAEEVAKILNVSLATVKVWRRKGLLRAYAATNKEYLMEPPQEGSLKKMRGVKLSTRLPIEGVMPNRAHEVQYAT